MPASSLLLPLLPLTAGLLTFAGQDGQPLATQTDIIAIRKDQWSRMTVPVKVVEQGPFRFLIDTGSQNTVLSRGLAQRLSLVPNRKARLVSVAGTQIVDTVDLDQIDLGRRSYYGLTAPLLESEHMGADGILGLDSLQGQRVLVDFKKGLMAIDDAKNLGGNRGFEIVVEARRRSGQLIMADAKMEGIKVQVVIDTGAETSIGNLALQRALSKKRKHEQIQLLSVTGDQINADLGYASWLEIAEMRFNNVAIAYTDAPAFKALKLDSRPSLLLGMRDLRSLDRLAIDFATRRILFDVPAGVL
ncbi:retroviral-like aspartic protease family protein [Novosphingobium sp. APW14]|jgi:predicted aspartyl protease|uniref:retroviral-like aspartic protease family protein n=1 Tax=Novosphingobium sp. APW14 TaxID=3077237 RepID=UPI0028DEF9AA|nr:retroviral-like aspartic protease family protein [Novosphingobium sp. APW14]MDT9013265.1 retroviral-like aspartic protease family protein [Novosphingobium sp. APW14]